MSAPASFAGPCGPMAGRRARPWLCALLLAAVLLCAPWLERPAEAAPARRLAQNPRGLALGGTGVSYANDEMALYYNPAGLGSIDNWWVELAPIALEASPEAVDLATQGDIGSFDSPGELIRKNIGKEIQVRGLYYPTGVFNLSRGLTLGVGAFYEAQTEMQIRNQATPEVNAFFRLDQGQVAGISLPAAEGKYLFGIAVRKIKRKTGEGVLSSAELALASARGNLDLEDSLDISEGSGTGYDVGMIWRIESLAFLRGQFGIAIQNVGGTKVGDAGEIPQDVGFGWTFRPEIVPFVDLQVSIEFRDATYELTDDHSANKRTHFGIELGVLPLDGSTDLVTARVGANAGQYSYGLELSLWHSFTLQYVVYYQEFGDSAGADPRKRQLVMLNFLGF